MEHDWKPLGVFSELSGAPFGDLDLWRLIGRWRRVGEIELPHPNYPRQIHRLAIYDVDVEGGSITFASGEVSPGGYAFYAPVKRSD